ncbi:MAG: triose-phosphate isomerase [Planctomycetota bacterium]
MRKIFIAGNWKMNLLRTTSHELLARLKDSLAGFHQVDIAVCPPSIYLSDAAQVLAGSNLGLGAQNVYSQPEGAYTGEISCAMLLDIGCRYVILGHSERRAIFGETDGMVNEKLKAALAAGLTPIVCIGETLQERESGRTLDVVSSQCRGSLAGLSQEQMGRTVLAYEPVWAIGTGKTATPAQAEEVHSEIRQLLASLFSPGVAEKVIIQYGGSVKPDGVSEILAKPNIDGALVGGASLKAESFTAIIEQAATIRK